MTEIGMIAQVLRDAVIISGELQCYETSTEIHGMGREWNWNAHAVKEAYNWIDRRTKRLGAIAQILCDSLIIAAEMKNVKTYSEKQDMNIRYCWNYDASKYAYHWINNIFKSEYGKEG